MLRENKENKELREMLEKLQTQHLNDQEEIRQFRLEHQKHTVLCLCIFVSTCLCVWLRACLRECVSMCLGMCECGVLKT